jgi:hypothetical protein
METCTVVIYRPPSAVLEASKLIACGACQPTACPLKVIRHERASLGLAPTHHGDLHGRLQLNITQWPLQVHIR